MTDHFKDCRPGDFVTVTMRGRFMREMGIVGLEAAPNERMWLDMSKHPAIISVTVEPRPLAVGDRVRHKNTKMTGTISAMGKTIAIVEFDGPPATEGGAAICNLERVND